MTETRIKVEDILEASKGMLQKQLYVVFTSPTNGLGPVMENIGPHLKYQVELEEKGIMLLVTILLIAFPGLSLVFA